MKVIISEELAASFNPGKGDKKFLWNTANFYHFGTLQYPEDYSEYAWSWKPQVSADPAMLKGIFLPHLHLHGVEIMHCDSFALLQHWFHKS